jgi:hypothetical protein
MHCNWQLNCLYVQFHDNQWANIYIILTHIGLMQNFDTPTHYFNGFPPILVGVPPAPQFDSRFSRNLQLLVSSLSLPSGFGKRHLIGVRKSHGWTFYTSNCLRCWFLGMLGWMNNLAPVHRNALPHSDRIYYIWMWASNARHGNAPQTMRNVWWFPLVTSCKVYQSIYNDIKWFWTCDKVTIEWKRPRPFIKKNLSLKKNCVALGCYTANGNQVKWT